MTLLPQIAGSTDWTDGYSCWRQPLMGRARNELAEGLRSLPMGRHVVFYVALGDGIDVVRVLHSARDIGALFGKSDQ